MSAVAHLEDGRIDHLITTYREGLLNDTLPFWIPRCVDREHGGFMFIRDRDGTLLDTDKGMWHQGRFSWLLAHLYNQVEPRKEWLELARHGIDFIRRHGFDTDGRMFFHVTRTGEPVRKRRYLFTEMFAIIALAEYAKAASDDRSRQEALDLFDLVGRYTESPDLLPPKFDTTTRPAKGLGHPMIMIATTQILREVADDPAVYTAAIDGYIREIRDDFMHHDLKVVMETVAPDGSMINHLDWRTITPGHSIEAAWFILKEAQYRNNDRDLIALGTTILEWMWEWGWDKEYGGITYFRDVTGGPVQEYWHDMKFWWPQNETIIASLLAYHLTGDPRYAGMHTQVHDWAYEHFPDPEFGEWYGYLHRDGSVSVPLKGNLWKGPFHLPRMQLVCWKTAQAIKDGRGKAEP